MILSARVGRPLAVAIFVLAANGYAAPVDKETCRKQFDGFKGELSKDPNNEAAWTSVRQCTTLLKRWNEGADIAHSVLEKNPDNASAHLILGITLMHLQDYPKASDEFTRTTTLKPDDALAFYYLGMAQLYMNHPEEAAEAADKASKLEPTNSIHFSQMAYAYLLMDERDKCEAAAKRAIEIDHNNIAAYKILGNLYAKQDRRADSEKMFEEAMHANGRNATANPFVPDKRELPGVTDAAKTGLTAAIGATVTSASASAPMAHSNLPEVADAPAASAVVSSTAIARAKARLNKPEKLPAEDEQKSDPADACGVQWQNMKASVASGDLEKALGYFSDYAGTRDQYRTSFQGLGIGHVKQIFDNIGDVEDCEAVLASVTCKAAVRGVQGTVMQTNVRFERGPDRVWRIRSF